MLILLALSALVALVTAIAPTAELWRTKRHPNRSWVGHQTPTEHIIHWEAPSLYRQPPRQDA